MKILYGAGKAVSDQKTLYLNANDLNITAGVGRDELTVFFLREIKNRIASSQKLSHLFKDYDFSLWWFIYAIIFPRISNILNFAFNFEKMINEKKPTKIEVASEFDKLNLMKQICRKTNVEIHYSTIRYFRFLIKNRIIKKIQKFRLTYIFSKKSKKRLGLFKSKRRNIPSLDGKIVFWVQTSYRRYSYDLEKGQNSRGEYIQGPIMKMLQNMNQEIVGIDMDISFRGDFQVLSERLDDSIPWFPVEAILENYPTNENYSKVINDYLSMIKSEEFKSFFNFNEINFWHQMKDDFDTLSYLPHLPNCIKLIESLQHFLKINTPRVVFIPNETSIMALAMIIACRKNNIKTIGIQHGFISHSFPRYLHDDFESENNPSGMPLPNFTLLFGDFAKKELAEKGIYPKEKLIVFGNPAFFNIDKVIKNLQSKDLRKKYNIPYNKKIILFATGKHQAYHMANSYGRKDFDEQILKRLLELFGNNDQYFVLLKPHPIGEFLGSYNNLINNYDARNFVVLQGDLFELLSICDVMISVFSTSFIDSIAFGKMTIRVTFEDYNIPIPLDEYGCLVSSNLNSLGENVDKLLFDTTLQQRLKNNAARCIEDQYNIPNDNAYEQLKSLLSI